MTTGRDGSVKFEQRGRRGSLAPGRVKCGPTSSKTKYYEGRSAPRSAKRASGADRPRRRRHYVARQRHGYLARTTIEIVDNELEAHAVNQVSAFNFTGCCVSTSADGSPPPARLACFIIAVDDTMDSILKLSLGRGTDLQGRVPVRGLNLSPSARPRSCLFVRRDRVRSVAPFMRGQTPRPARKTVAHPPPREMVVRDVDHPDPSRGHRDEVARGAQDPARSVTPGSTWNSVAKNTSVQYQNRNNAVRVSDAFCARSRAAPEFHMRRFAKGRLGIETVDARPCPKNGAGGMGVASTPASSTTDTINDWHTNTRDRAASPRPILLPS